MIRKFLQWCVFGKLEAATAELKTAESNVEQLVSRVRAKVVSDADVVFVAIKGADQRLMAEARKQLTNLAPGIRFIVHDESVKVSAVIKQLESKVKAAVRKPKK